MAATTILIEIDAALGHALVAAGAATRVDSDDGSAAFADVLREARKLRDLMVPRADMLAAFDWREVPEAPIMLRDGFGTPYEVLRASATGPDGEVVRLHLSGEAVGAGTLYVEVPVEGGATHFVSADVAFRSSRQPPSVSLFEALARRPGPAVDFRFRFEDDGEEFRGVGVDGQPTTVFRYRVHDMRVGKDRIVISPDVLAVERLSGKFANLVGRGVGSVVDADGGWSDVVVCLPHEVVRIESGLPWSRYLEGTTA